MTEAMDRRFAERRRTVAEQGARRRLGRILAIAIVAAVCGLTAWVVRSPLLEVKDLVIEGGDRSDPVALLDAAGIARGKAMVSVDETVGRNALLADPWIAEAEVRTVWPNTVEVTVLEYLPTAWVAGPDEWYLVSLEGAVVAAASDPGPGYPEIAVPVARMRPGDAIIGRDVLGSIEFVASLDDDVAAGVRVDERGGELWANVAGFDVRLGRPVAMVDKAAALQALLEQGLPEGSRLDLIAPTRPAVAPGVPAEAEGEAGDEPLP